MGYTKINEPVKSVSMRKFENGSYMLTINYNGFTVNRLCATREIADELITEYRSQQ